MCRSIQTLRPPYHEAGTPAEIEAAALQYVRKIAGMRAPSARNAPAFDAAVAAVAAATAELLDGLVVRPGRQTTTTSSAKAVGSRVSSAKLATSATAAPNSGAAAAAPNAS